MPLITAAQFRDQFPALIGTGEDTRILELVDRADALMHAWLGMPVPQNGVRTLETTQYELRLDGPSVMYPRALDLGSNLFAAPSEVASSTLWDWSDDFASEVYYDAPRGLLWLNPTASHSWVDAPLGNRVVTDGGWLTAPDEVVAATVFVVRKLIDLPRTQGVAALTQGGQSVTRTDLEHLIPLEAQHALQPYICWGSRVG